MGLLFWANKVVKKNQQQQLTKHTFMGSVDLAGPLETASNAIM